MEIIDAELRLGPPGSGSGCDVVFGATVAQKKRPPSSSVARSEASGTDDPDAAPSSKVQVVGWPPVGAYRKSTFQASASEKEKAGAGEVKEAAGKRSGGGLYVKVSMDGAPYLRKVDLRTYGGYKELRDGLDALFGCFSSPADNGGQFAVAYRVRGQGRGPHARRGRAMGHVHQFLQEAEDYERLRGTMIRT